MTSGTSSYGKKEGIYGNQTLFRELGYYILRLEHYEKSLEIFDEAIANTPNDIRALIGRSRSRARASHYKGALQDINKALKLDPDNLTVLAEKALDTYLSCEFEEGLLQNSRLLPKRQKPDHFHLGFMHCSNAIETCVGEYAGRPLRDHFKIIRKLSWKENRKLLEGQSEKKKRKKPIQPFFVDDAVEMIPSIVNRKRKDNKQVEISESQSAIRESLHSHMSEKYRVPPFLEEFPFRPLQNYTTNITNFMAEKYLESMYRDKNFLKKLETQPGASCPNQKGTEKIKFLAKRGYKMVAFKQELLRTRRPFYHIKYKEGTSTATLKLRKAQELFIQQTTTRKEADLMLAQLQNVFTEKKFRAMMEIAEKLLKFCDSKPKRLLPDKDKYLQKIFKTIRSGIYNLFRLNLNQYPWDQVKRIHIALGLPISRDPSTDSVIDDSRPLLRDNKKQMTVLEKRLREPEQVHEETCWCYYEMCKNSVEMKQYEIAKIYAKQCIQEAKRTQNVEWMFNITMLLMRVHIELRNKTDALKELNNASRIAEELENENLDLYLKKCSEVIETIEYDPTSGTGVVAKREQNILGILNVNLKGEFSHLFRQMSALPASRRMPIVPGFRAADASERQNLLAKRKSIAQESLPQEDLVEEAFQEKIAMKRTETSKGLGFMKLIQYHIEE